VLLLRALAWIVLAIQDQEFYQSSFLQPLVLVLCSIAYPLIIGFVLL
jgi:hypothetical protein